MATRTPGMRTVKKSWHDPLERKRVSLHRENRKQPSAGDQAASKKFNDDFKRKAASQWGVAPEHVELWISDPDAYREMLRQRDSERHPKVADHEARIAVEGNTDLNHDNVEAAE